MCAASTSLTPFDSLSSFWLKTPSLFARWTEFLHLDALSTRWSTKLILLASTADWTWSFVAFSTVSNISFGMPAPISPTTLSSLTFIGWFSKSPKPPLSLSASLNASDASAGDSAGCWGERRSVVWDLDLLITPFLSTGESKSKWFPCSLGPIFSSLLSSLDSGVVAGAGDVTNVLLHVTNDSSTIWRLPSGIALSKSPNSSSFTSNSLSSFILGQILNIPYTSATVDNNTAAML